MLYVTYQVKAQTFATSWMQIFAGFFQFDIIVNFELLIMLDKQFQNVTLRLRWVFFFN